MGIEIRTKGKVAILDVFGTLDAGMAESDWSRTLAELLDNGTRNIILNLNKLAFMDSITLGETVRCATRTRARNGEFKIVLKPGGKPEEVIKIASLDQALELFYDEGEAIASFIK